METTERNIDILCRVINILEHYSDDRDVSRLENILIRRLQLRAMEIFEDYIPCFKEEEL